MIRAASVFPALVFGAASVACVAQTTDPLELIARAQATARYSNYAGLVIHVSGERATTARITHILLAGEEHEKVESLDGPAREIVRHNDDLQCFYPDAKTVRLDRRITARFFPSILQASPQAIAESYTAKLGDIDRVLGRDCQWIKLEPKDALRFAQRLCAELGSGMLLRSLTLNAKNQVLEQFAFTELRTGHQVSRGEVKSTFHAQTKGWQTDSQPREEAKAVDTGWQVATPPAGFRKVAEMRRSLPGRKVPVSQLVYSDGLASFSVFIEPAGANARTAETTSEEGSFSVFMRPLGDQQVTVLGEVPAAAVQLVGRSVARKP